MAAGCDSAFRGVVAAAAGLAVAAIGLSATGASAAPAPTSFNPSIALPAASGASHPQVVVDATGGMTVIGSTAPGEGCVLSTVSRDGSTARYLGRTAGGAACSIAPGLATSSGAGFPWADSSRPDAMAAMIADPGLGATGLTTLYLVVRDATTGLPRIATSTDGGLTYASGSTLINPADIPAGQWQGAGPVPVVGNLVARRDDAGLHLYTVIETADSATDRAAQQVAATDNLNRVYTAIGTVAPSLTGGAPSVTWRDHLAYAAPAGVGLNRALPATAVDSAGRVYDTFADGSHTYVKSDFDGTHWVTAALPIAVDVAALGLPAGLNASALPAIAAGGLGDVDLVWYGATGGSSAQADPTSDPANAWAVYMAQTLNGGATWTGYTVSDHVVHAGALDATAAGDAASVAIDQVTGAADVAYTDDQSTPNLPSLFATRQCTGPSAVSGLALIDGCVAPQPATPVLPGSTCPGPQITDGANDATTISASGIGTSLDSLDLLEVKFISLGPAEEQAQITLNRLATTPAPGVSSQAWRVFWTSGGTAWYAQAEQRTGHGRPVYTVGSVNPDGTLATGHRVAGSLAPGSLGTINIAIPLADAGSPASGQTFTAVHADTTALFGTGTTGAPAAMVVDRGPDGGSGADYAVGQVCAPQIDTPEVPFAAMLPAAGGFMLYACRRRSRRTAGCKSTHDTTGGCP